MWRDTVEQLAQRLEPTGEVGLDALYEDEPGAWYYRLLYRLAAHYRPAVSVELGVCHGRSTAHMAAANPQGRVIAVDLDVKPLFHQLAPRYPNIEFRPVASTDTDLLLSVAPRSVGLCFVDTVHTYDQVMAELQVWLPKMCPGGWLVFDDIGLNEGMVRFWNKFELPKLSLPHLHWSGFGVARVPVEQEEALPYPPATPAKLHGEVCR